MSEWRVGGYSELRVLGEGAQGRVVLVRHDATGSAAAIKYLGDALVEDVGFRERFRDEARLLARLRNPYVARLYGLVEEPGGAAIVMEAVDGVPLKTVLSERGPLEPEAALTVLKGSLLGLAAAHDLGIVHRDYKPANVIVRADGLSKLIDFGIAVEAGEAGGSGTPIYMAPEQWRAEPASPATDVYAATCVFYECVTGHRPYTADDADGLRERHLTDPIPVADVPEPLRELVKRGMAKDPWERPLGAAAFVEELENAATRFYGGDWEGRGVRTLAGAAAALSTLFPLTALGIGSGGAGAGAAGTAAGTTAGKGVAGALGAKGAAAVAGGAAAVAVGGGAAVYVAVQDEGPPPRPAIAVELVSLNEPQRRLETGDTWRAQGQVVRVTGIRDAVIARRVDRMLREPIDRLFTRNRQGLGASGTTTFVNVVRPTVTLRNERLLSVWYDTELRGVRGMNTPVAVTVDLRTWKEYRAADLFRVRTEAGLAPLDRMAARHLPDLTACRNGGGPALAEPLLRDQVAMALTPTGVRIGFNGVAAMGFSMSCAGQAGAVPYAEMSALMKPELLAAVPYPSPARS